jgi:hypothetical protein
MRQSSNINEAFVAISGALNDAIAFTNCPKVRELASLSPFTILDNRGFNETCIRVLPIPNKEKVIISDVLSYHTNGIIIDKAVTNKLIITVFFLPIRDINIPVGTENIRNQKKTIDGNIFAVASSSPKSFCA